MNLTYRNEFTEYLKEFIIIMEIQIKQKKKNRILIVIIKLFIFNRFTRSISKGIITRIIESCENYIFITAY